MDQKTVREILDWLKFIAIAVVLAFLIRNYVVLSIKVPTPSMLPTIQLGDQLLVNRFLYRFKPPKRGDIVVFKYPDNPEELYVKRLIGVGGDEVEVKEGKLHVNGQKIEEDYLYEEMRGSFGPYKVPEGRYFMMGDNRNNSKDSRVWQNQYVTDDLIIGKAFFRLFPLSSAGVMK
ncbi:MAG: signal peptidase I [Firmicutes bacterium]|nr:signal peptidase I [Bacillota bacterium]MDD3298195.1 signal peptidase I [Bacillota bacterium]MDD4707055.1 signal peptidase I [Bacillota bacterium]